MQSQPAILKFFIRSLGGTYIKFTINVHVCKYSLGLYLFVWIDIKVCFGTWFITLWHIFNLILVCQRGIGIQQKNMYVYIAGHASISYINNISLGYCIGSGGPAPLLRKLRYIQNIIKSDVTHSHITEIEDQIFIYALGAKLLDFYVTWFYTSISHFRLILYISFYKTSPSKRTRNKLQKELPFQPNRISLKQYI